MAMYKQLPEDQRHHPVRNAGMNIAAAIITEPIMLNISNTSFDLLQAICGSATTTVTGMFITGTSVTVGLPISIVVASSSVFAYILYRKLNKSYSKYYEIINMINTYNTLLTRMMHQLTLIEIAQQHYGFQYMDNSRDVTSLIMGLTTMFSKFISPEEQAQIIEAAKRRVLPGGSNEFFWNDVDFIPTSATDKELSDSSSKSMSKKISNWWGTTSASFMWNNMRTLGLNKNEWLSNFSKTMTHLSTSYSVYMHEHANMLQIHKSVLNNADCDRQYGVKVAKSSAFRCITMMGILHPLIVFREKIMACMMSTNSPVCKSINGPELQGYLRKMLSNIFFIAPPLNHSNIDQEFRDALAQVKQNIDNLASVSSESGGCHSNVHNDRFKAIFYDIYGRIHSLTAELPAPSAGGEHEVTSYETYIMISNSLYYLLANCGTNGRDEDAPDNYMFNGIDLNTPALPEPTFSNQILLMTPKTIKSPKKSSKSAKSSKSSKSSNSLKRAPQTRGGSGRRRISRRLN